MRSCHRQGKVNQMLVAIVPPLVFVSGLIIYNAYKWIAPSAFSVADTKKVEALEVLDGFSATAKNGLLIPQPQSLRSGGSSRLVICRSADDGAFLFITGSVSAGFLAEKNPLDNMLHLKFSSTSIRVESGGEPVDAVLLLPRHVTDPLVVDDPTTDPEKDAFSQLFLDPSLLPAPVGTISAGKFTSNNGMTVECEFGLGQSGTLNFGDVAQLQFTLDSMSTAWVEAPRNIRVQHQAVGSEDLEIGLLIPRDTPGTEPFTVVMFGEEVATARRR